MTAAGVIPACAGGSNSKSARGLIARDHPHVCGEQTPRLLVACYRSGSSPRVRGTEGEYCVDEVVHGIIPAYVGSSWPDTGSGTSRWDHPCVCGEQPQSWAEPYRGSGSSPRMRGAASSTQAPLSSAGIIPARAGSRHSQGASWPPLGDHPRACGEQRSAEFLAPWSPGSSPRVRGAVRVHRRNERRPGIIPACAGSRLGGRCPVGPERDHPRVYGEQHSYSGKVHTFQGSSPRGRGAGVLEGEHRLRRGIIPARAGSRNGATHCPSARRDHPRACGEQVERSIMSMGVTRSSPRMRGAVLLIVTSPLDSGIIPACAGSSGCARGRCGARRGHPRVCGEQYLLSYTAMPPAGSSPRVRGAVHEVGRVAQAHGIIPARAGSSSCIIIRTKPFRDHPRACGEQNLYTVQR